MRARGTDPSVPPDRESAGSFGVHFESSFVLSDDGRYVVAPDARDARRLLVEDLSTGASFEFGENEDVVLTLFFEKDSGTLLAGDQAGYLVEYCLDLRNAQGRVIKKHGNLGISGIRSSFGSMGLVFLGGLQDVRVYDLSSKQMLPGGIETAFVYITSLQVCVVEESRVCLAMAGVNARYSSARSDLYDLSGLLEKVFPATRLTEQDRPLSKSDAEQIRAKDLQIAQLQGQLSGATQRIRGSP